MVTKTAPKRLSPVRASLVTVSEQDKRRIAECLGIHVSRQSDQLHIAIADLQGLLARANSRFNSLSEMPQPAHIIAELRQIAIAAEALAQALQLDRMHPAVWRELTADINQLAAMRQWAASLNDAASDAIERHSSRNRKGAALTAFKETLENVDAALLRVFNTHRIVSDVDDAEGLGGAFSEFLKICRKYLPAAPNKRGAYQKQN